MLGLGAGPVADAGVHGRRESCWAGNRLPSSSAAASRPTASADGSPRNLPATARLIGQDHRGFYIPRGYTMELAHRRRTGLGQNGESPREIVETLKQEGFTHLMLCPPVAQEAVEFDPTLGRLLSPWLAGRAPLFREDLTDADGVVRQLLRSTSSAKRRLGARGKESLAR